MWFGVWGLGCRVSDFGFRVSGFGFWVSSFGFRVSGSECRCHLFVGSPLLRTLLTFRVPGSDFGVRDEGVGTLFSLHGFGERSKGQLKDQNVCKDSVKDQKAINR